MTDHVPLALLLAEDHPVAVLVLESGRVVAANAAATALLGARAEPGAEVASFFDERSRGKLAAALAVRGRATIELQCLRRGRGLVPIRFRIEPLRTSTLLVALDAGAGIAPSMSSVLLDANARLANLTRELSLRSAELAAANARLEHIGELRDEFIATLSHDIRTPLAAIVLGAAMVEHPGDAPAVEDAARRARSIRRNAERVLRLVDDILAAARLDSGRLELARAPVSLVAIAGEVADSSEALASQAGVRIEVVPTETPGVVAGDRTSLFQVLSNLVGNAVRHSPAGGSVRIAIDERGGTLRCSVTDQGPGVAPDQRERVFERFQRGAEGGGSSGLGLYIVRRIVELHGGRVWVEPAEPRGAVFAFELPAA